MHPISLSHQKFPELLDFISNDVVRDTLVELRDHYFEIEDTEYVSLVKLFFERENLPLRIKEILADGLYTSAMELKSDDETGKIDKLMADIEVKFDHQHKILKEQKLLQKMSEVTDPKEKELLMKQIFNIRKSIRNNKVRKTSPKI